MRQLLFSLILTTFFFYTNAQKEQVNIQSKIEKVTIFLQGAQVERSAKQNLQPGKYNIFFGGISSKIDVQSIQLKAEGKLTVLSVTHQINFLEEQQVQDEIKQLEIEKEQLQDKISMEKNIQNVYKQEEELISKNQTIKGENSTLKASELKDIADFQRLRLTEIYQKLLENDHNLKKMNMNLQKLNKQLIELNQKKDLSTSEVIVAVDVKESVDATFHLSYLVKHASWFPTYDIRVLDISKPITLQMKANINQQSGEDWKDVKLFLSTGDPNENGTKPTLNPWYLKYFNPAVSSNILIRGLTNLSGNGTSNFVSGRVQDEKGKPIPFATILAKGTKSGVATDDQGYFTIQLPEGFNNLIVSSVGYKSQEILKSAGFATVTLQKSEESLNEIVVVGYGTRQNSNDLDYSTDSVKTFKKKKEETNINTTTYYQPTNTIFEIENPYSVPNDGKVYTVEINNFELNALYEYYSAPKLDASAYLTAKITEWQELNLLPGNVNLFFEGTFIGNSFLDLLAAGDTLKLSLGKDKGVVVKRTLMKEYSQKKFLGSNKSDSREYEILVRNNKQQPINIIIEDQFPISTAKEIEVEKLSYDGGKLDDDTKKLIWSLNIDGKKETKIQLGYTIKYPKDKTLQID